MPSRLLGLVHRYASITRVNQFAEEAVLIVDGAFYYGQSSANVGTWWSGCTSRSTKWWPGPSA